MGNDDSDVASGRNAGSGGGLLRRVVELSLRYRVVVVALAVVFAVWLARGGTKQLPGMAKQAWHRVQAAADSVWRK